MGFIKNNERYIQIIDISNPTHPIEVNLFETDISSIRDLDYHYGDLYLAGYSEGLHIFDVSDPTNPIETGYYNTPGHAWAVHGSGELAYVADEYYFGIYDCDDAVPVDPEEPSVAPLTSVLLGAYPNPFNPTTVISYQLPVVSHIELSVYDIEGRLVSSLVNGWRDAGYHEVRFDGVDLTSGVYIYQLKAGDLAESGKIVLMK